MTLKTALPPFPGEIQQTRNMIRRSWSHEERVLRQRTAIARQRRFLNMLFQQQTTVLARVV